MGAPPLIPYLGPEDAVLDLELELGLEELDHAEVGPRGDVLEDGVGGVEGAEEGEAAEVHPLPHHDLQVLHVVRRRPVQEDVEGDRRALVLDLLHQARQVDSVDHLGPYETCDTVTYRVTRLLGKNLP